MNSLTHVPINAYRIPSEIINMIADYRDYDKYSKPKHKSLFKTVIDDIDSIGSIMEEPRPTIVHQCWGSGFTGLFYDDYNEENLGLDYDADYDDEENNFGLDYDDTHYYAHDEDTLLDAYYNDMIELD